MNYGKVWLNHASFISDFLVLHSLLYQTKHIAPHDFGNFNDSEKSRPIDFIHIISNAQPTVSSVGVAGEFALDYFAFSIATTFFAIVSLQLLSCFCFRFVPSKCNEIAPCVCLYRRCSEIEKIASFAHFLCAFRFTHAEYNSIRLEAAITIESHVFCFEWNMSWFWITIGNVWLERICVSVWLMCCGCAAAATTMRYGQHDVSAKLVLNARSINICTGVLSSSFICWTVLNSSKWYM